MRGSRVARRWRTTLRSNKRRTFRFIAEGRGARAKLWRIAYVLDYHGPCWLAGNRPSRVPLVYVKPIIRSHRTDSDGPIDRILSTDEGRKHWTGRVRILAP